jgi:hypothetical protein
VSKPERRDRLVQIVRQLPEATFPDLVDARFRVADESVRGCAWTAAPNGPAQPDTLIVDPQASRFVVRGREMDGWLQIDIGARASDDELNRWIKHGGLQR